MDDINDRRSEMDKGKHSQVIRTWKVERIRTPGAPKEHDSIAVAERDEI